MQDPTTVVEYLGATEAGTIGKIPNTGVDAVAAELVNVPALDLGSVHVKLTVTDPVQVPGAM